MSLQHSLAQDAWDSPLSQLLWAFRVTPHCRTEETPNYLMVGKECRMSDQLVNRTHSMHLTSRSGYVLELNENLDSAFGLRNQQMLLWQLDEYADGPMYNPGDLVLVGCRHKSSGAASIAGVFILGSVCVMYSQPRCCNYFGQSCHYFSAAAATTTYVVKQAAISLNHFVYLLIQYVLILCHKPQNHGR